MSRFGRILLAVFRVVQLLCSIIVVGCGAYIVYEMFSLASSAKQMEQTIDLLQNKTYRREIEDALQPALNITDNDITDFSKVLDDTLVPVLHHLEGAPTRALIIAITGIWSTGVIVYMFLANRKSSKPGMNRRSVRVPLELVTLILWLASVACAILLSLEYGFVALAGGAETKEAFTALKPLLKAALNTLFKDDNSIMRSLSIVDDIVTIGALSILATASSSVCALVSIVSCIVACCYSGRRKESGYRPTSEAAETFFPANNNSNNNDRSSRNKGVTEGYEIIEIPSPWTPPVHHYQHHHSPSPSHSHSHSPSHGSPGPRGYYDPVYQDNNNDAYQGGGNGYHATTAYHVNNGYHGA